MRRCNLTKKHNTKPERILGRLLQEAHIPFRTKVVIEGREVDFLIGKLAIEVDGHDQDPEKNHILIKAGYTPIHFHNTDIYNNRYKLLNYIINYGDKN